MAFSIFRAKQPKAGTTGTTTIQEVACDELFHAALEYQIRELSFWTCVNMVANAIGRCEVRTYRDHKEIREREYYLWNIEPNTNQNSTAFWHKFVAKLFEDNEALIISTRKRDGYDALVVADDWSDPDWYPSRRNEYRKVRVWDFTYDKTFYEDNVLHVVLNHKDMREVTKRIYESYYKLIQAAMKAYQWSNGQHWKVHVDQIAGGKDGWADTFQQMIEAQIRPFLESNGAILPEFDGYKYENVGVGHTGNASKVDTRDIKALIQDIFQFTAQGFGIPYVLVNGTVEGTADANQRFLTGCIDPICDQLQEEINRKRYGYDAWAAGTYARVDSSAIIHFDLFSQAANIEKLIGTGWTINDIRRAIGEAEINEPWANQHFLTKNIGEMAALDA